VAAADDVSALVELDSDPLKMKRPATATRAAISEAMAEIQPGPRSLMPRRFDPPSSGKPHPLDNAVAVNQPDPGKTCLAPECGSSWDLSRPVKLRSGVRATTARCDVAMADLGADGDHVAAPPDSRAT
jgi:hypothetical protein